MVKMRFIRIVKVVVLAIALVNTKLIAQGLEDSTLFSNDFFDQVEPVNITLEFDIRKYMKEKSDSIYLPAILSYYKDSIEIHEDVRIKARGVSRRRHCFMPPFWLNVKNTNLVNDSLFNAKKIKVVTDCRGGKIYENYLFNEFLLYNIYNLITENSFKVRLLNIKYVDTGRNKKSQQSWAFMIEPENRLASRIEALPIEFDNLNYRHADSLSADIMCFFQYMIGNTDFTVNGRHNIKLYKYKDFTKPDLITVPYDFDFAGFINTDYANPAEILELENVTERYYLGMCRTDEQYYRVIEIFNDKKKEIYELVNSYEYLSHVSRRSAIKYLDEFYNEMNKSNFLKKKLRKTCRR